jgi:hypothetical protein
VTILTIFEERNWEKFGLSWVASLISSGMSGIVYTSIDLNDFFNTIGISQKPGDLKQAAKDHLDGFAYVAPNCYFRKFFTPEPNSGNLPGYFCVDANGAKFLADGGNIDDLTFLDNGVCGIPIPGEENPFPIFNIPDFKCYYSEFYSFKNSFPNLYNVWKDFYLNRRPLSRHLLSWQGRPR